MSVSKEDVDLIKHLKRTLEPEDKFKSSVDPKVAIQYYKNFFSRLNTSKVGVDPLDQWMRRNSEHWSKD